MYSQWMYRLCLPLALVLVLRRSRHKGWVWKRSDLGLQIGFEKCRMKLYNIPVSRSQRLDMYSVRQRRLEVREELDLGPIVKTEGAGEG